MRSVVSTLAPAVAVVAVVAVVAGFLVLLDRHLGGRVRALLCAVGVLGALATTWLLWPSGRLATRILDPVEGNPRALLVLGALALLATVGLGALAAAVRRHPTPAAELVLLAVAMVVAATWLPKSGWPAWRADGLDRLNTCLVTDPRWGTPGLRGLLTDALPNVALYLPLGMALAAALARHRWSAVLLAAGLSFGSEALQALATDRVCKVNDIVTNVLGTLLGILLFAALDRYARGRQAAALRQG